MSKIDADIAQDCFARNDLLELKVLIEMAAPQDIDHNAILSIMENHVGEISTWTPDILRLLTVQGADMERTLKLALKHDMVKAILPAIGLRLNKKTANPDRLNAILSIMENHVGEISTWTPDIFRLLTVQGADVERTLKLALKHDMVKDILSAIDWRLNKKTENPDRLLETLDQYKGWWYPKGTKELAGLLAEHGADFSGCKHIRAPKDSIAQGQGSPGFNPLACIQRGIYVFSSKRPEVAIPALALPAPAMEDSWQSGMRRARESKTDLKSAVTKGGLRAFAAIMAANTAKLEQMVRERQPEQTISLKELQNNAQFYRSEAASLPLDAATEQAAGFADPALLHEVMLALPTPEMRQTATRVLIKHTSLVESILAQEASAQTCQAENTKIKAAMKRLDCKVSINSLKRRLKDTPGTIIGEESLKTLETIAERAGAAAAIDTLNAQPQSFDVHFIKTVKIGERSLSFRPWNWLRGKFHADAWYPRLADYRKDLANWQEKDPEKSFALLKRLLSKSEELGKTLLPLEQKAKQAGEIAAFFTEAVAQTRKTQIKLHGILMHASVQRVGTGNGHTTGRCPASPHAPLSQGRLNP